MLVITIDLEINERFKTIIKSDLLFRHIFKYILKLLLYMTLIDLEKRCKKIVDLRAKKQKIQQDINKEVLEVLTYMNDNNKKNIKIGDYSIEVVKMIRRNFDFKFLDDLQNRGIIPIEKMNKVEYQRVLIATAKNIKLIDGKFVYEKNE
jgi:hypothetical protein